MSWNSGQVRNISRVDETLLEATLYAGGKKEVLSKLVTRPSDRTEAQSGHIPNHWSLD